MSNENGRPKGQPIVIEPTQKKTPLDQEQKDCVQHLLDTAHGAALILGVLGENHNVGDFAPGIHTGLSYALRLAADEVDAYIFESPGDLAETLEHEVLIRLLKSEIDRISTLQRAEEGE
jgi:hypothetical protein